MATFIDDQGGTGWTPGSHTHFRLAAVWIPTANVSPFKTVIQMLRQELGLRSDYEFKFSKTHQKPEWRARFYRIALDLGLRFTACGFDKRRIKPGSVEAFVFYQVCAVSLAVHLRNTYLVAEQERCVATNKPILLSEPILVDDNKDTSMLLAIEEAFRALRSGNVLLTNKPKFRDSAKDETLQLADMIMGAVGAHLDGDSSWYNMIESRNLGVVNLGGCQDDLSEHIGWIKEDGPEVLWPTSGIQSTA